MSEPIFDPSELDAESLELWRFLDNTNETLPMAARDLMEFAFLCARVLQRVPEAVERRLKEVVPDHWVADQATLRGSRTPRSEPPENPIHEIAESDQPSA